VHFAEGNFPAKTLEAEHAESVSAVLRVKFRGIVIGVVMREDKAGSGFLGMSIELAPSLSVSRFERPNN
jgi:hypothetical protein